MWKKILSIILVVSMVASSGVFDSVQIHATADEVFVGTGITLDSTTLKASWPNGTGGTDFVDLSIGSETKFPYNSDIDMQLNFTIPKDTTLTVGTPYVYTVPENIRVDAEADHDLLDPDGVTSTGTVHISKDGKQI